jgi:glycosyltransferase involved in cell wall biosynthesis
MQFSVIFPIHILINKEQFIVSFESIINQTLLPKEIIIICDGKIQKDIDDFLMNDLIKKTDIIIRILRNEINAGPGFSRNIGVLNSTTDYIAFMDADDLSISNRFQLQIDHFLETDNDIIGGQIEEYNESLSKFINKREVPTNFEEIKKSMKYRNTINNVTVMMKKDVFNKLGGYPNLYFGEDYLLWLKAIENNFKLSNLSDTLVLVRTNRNFVVKRLGFKNFRNNLHLCKYLYKYKSVGFFFTFYRIVKVSIMTILPIPIKKIIFFKFNR